MEPLDFKARLDRLDRLETQYRAIFGMLARLDSQHTALKALSLALLDQPALQFFGDALRRRAAGPLVPPLQAAAWRTSGDDSV